MGTWQGHDLGFIHTSAANVLGASEISIASEGTDKAGMISIVSHDPTTTTLLIRYTAFTKNKYFPFA
jgi:hypothetical protein